MLSSDSSATIIPSVSEAGSSAAEELGTDFDVQRSMLSSDSLATIDQADLEELQRRHPGGIESTQYASIKDMVGSTGQDVRELKTPEVPARVGGSAALPQHPLTHGVIPESLDDSEFMTRAAVHPEVTDSLPGAQFDLEGDESPASDASLTGKISTEY